MHCRDVIARLSEYLDHEMPADPQRDLEAHCVVCTECRVFVDTVRKTIALYRRETVLECPEQVKLRLQTLLAIEYRKK